MKVHTDFSSYIDVKNPVVTVGTFETAKRRPEKLINFASGYTSYGRGRTYTIWRDKKGNAHKVPMDPNDPGGEHE